MEVEIHCTNQKEELFISKQFPFVKSFFKHPKTLEWLVKLNETKYHEWHPVIRALHASA